MEMCNYKPQETINMSLSINFKYKHKIFTLHVLEYLQKIRTDYNKTKVTIMTFKNQSASFNEGRTMTQKGKKRKLMESCWLTFLQCV